MPVPILKLGDTLIVSIQAELDDAELTRLRADIAERVGSRGVRGLGTDRQHR